MNPTDTPAAPTQDETARRRSIAFLNFAHALDHFVLLIYPTVVIGLEVVYRRPYAELIALSTAAFVAFGVFSLPAGWLADRWSRRNMMAAFYLGCGVSLAGVGPSSLAAPASLGILVGLFFGKQIGVFGSTYVAVRLKLTSLPTGVTWRQIYGVSLLAGIGFTMSLFIASLAYGEGTPLQVEAKLGILVASALSAAAGLLVLARRP